MDVCVYGIRKGGAVDIEQEWWVETVEEELPSLSERKVCLPKLDIASGALSCSKN
jgi:hypothetical protein